HAQHISCPAVYSRLVQPNSADASTHYVTRPKAPNQIIPFSAFWLRSSVVSVLISLISDMVIVACHVPCASPSYCTAGRAWRAPTKAESIFVNVHWLNQPNSADASTDYVTRPRAPNQIIPFSAFWLRSSVGDSGLPRPLCVAQPLHYWQGLAHPN
ncbi:hypothetical protein U9M48_038446, partial [Paspalum notatum var. saurae]